MPDAHVFQHFISAQDDTYANALAEIRRGRKSTHWMWFIFPQLLGLGRSSMARAYGIRSLAEARDYLQHPLLGSRLRECVAALQDLPPMQAEQIFGPVDAMKLRSSLTLFVQAGGGALFVAALDRWFGGEADELTQRLLADLKAR